MTTALADMHNEHQHWLSDNAFWRDEVAVWQRELDDARQGLLRLEGVLRDHRSSLHDHLDTIAAEEHARQELQRTLAELGKGRSPEELEELLLAMNHKRNTGGHAQQRDVHEKLKKRHHTVMAHWSLLVRALTR
jgi:hypothetical protein